VTPPSTVEARGDVLPAADSQRVAVSSPVDGLLDLSVREIAGDHHARRGGLHAHAVLITEVFAWLTAFDDHYERAGAHMAEGVPELVDALERHDGVPHTPVNDQAMTAFAAVRARCGKELEPGQYGRFTDALCRYFLAVRCAVPPTSCTGH
jgi:hypothetical protein